MKSTIKLRTKKLCVFFTYFFHGFFLPLATILLKRSEDPLATILLKRSEDPLAMILLKRSVDPLATILLKRSAGTLATILLKRSEDFSNDPVEEV